ncbi:granulin a, partial [Tachysurus ichikawai]
MRTAVLVIDMLFLCRWSVGQFLMFPVTTLRLVLMKPHAVRQKREDGPAALCL